MQAVDGPHTDGYTYRTVRVSNAYDVRFAIDPDSEDPIGRFLLSSETFGDPPIDLFVALLRPGMRIVDVGAHIGTYSLTAAAAGCEVLAVEGARANVDLLRAAAAEANEGGASRLTIVHAAVTDHTGTVEFSSHMAWGHVSLVEDRSGGLEPTVTPATTVDALIEYQGWPRADLLKVDVEGGEAAVVAGAQATLARQDGPRLLLEINGIMLQRYGSSELELRHVLAAAGYSFLRVDRRNKGRLVSRMAAEVEFEGVADYLLSKRGHALDELDGWTIAPWSKAEELDQALAALSETHAPYRAFAAASVQRAPRWLRWRREVRERLYHLRKDEDHSVRAASAWSSRGERLLIAWWWTAPLRQWIRDLARRLTGRAS